MRAEVPCRHLEAVKVGSVGAKILTLRVVGHSLRTIMHQVCSIVESDA